MFNIFSKKQQKNTNKHTAKSSVLGRAITDIHSAKVELSEEAIEFNPLKYLQKNAYFLGVEHNTKNIKRLKKNEVVHSLITAPTRSGKGIFFGIKAIETLRENQKGLIIIDPKQDDWLAQVISEELERQDRQKDFIILNWPNDFGYKTFESDTAKEAAKKLTIMLNLIEVEAEAGASHYRKSERIMLHKVVNYFYNSKELLKTEFPKNLLSLITFFKYLSSDLKNSIDFNKEFSKNKPNVQSLREYSTRYFEPSLFVKLDIKERDLNTLDSLYFSLSEFSDVTFTDTESTSILDALTKGKCIYIKSDMLDESALKFLKFILADIIQKAKKHKNETNCLVLADEVSFYPTPILSATLSTIAGFNVQFMLAYQDDAQLQDENLKAAIKSNCQTKIYYKSSDIATLEYIEKLSGLELVSKTSKADGKVNIKQETEEYLNITKQRALPKSQVAILIQESRPIPIIFDTQPVPVEKPFEWDEINSKEIQIERFELEQKYSVLETQDTKKEKEQEQKSSSKIEDNQTTSDDVVKVDKFDI